MLHHRIHQRLRRYGLAASEGDGERAARIAEGGKYAPETEKVGSQNPERRPTVETEHIFRASAALTRDHQTRARVVTGTTIERRHLRIDDLHVGVEDHRCSAHRECRRAVQRIDGRAHTEAGIQRAVGVVTDQELVVSPATHGRDPGHQNLAIALHRHAIARVVGPGRREHRAATAEGQGRREQVLVEDAEGGGRTSTLGETHDQCLGEARNIGDTGQQDAPVRRVDGNSRGAVVHIAGRQEGPPVELTEPLGPVGVEEPVRRELEHGRVFARANTTQIGAVSGHEDRSVGGERHAERTIVSPGEILQNDTRAGRTEGRVQCARIGESDEHEIAVQAVLRTAHHDAARVLHHNGRHHFAACGDVHTRNARIAKARIGRAINSKPQDRDEFTRSVGGLPRHQDAPRCIDRYRPPEILKAVTADIDRRHPVTVESGVETAVRVQANDNVVLIKTRVAEVPGNHNAPIRRQLYRKRLILTASTALESHRTTRAECGIQTPVGQVAGDDKRGLARSGIGVLR